MTCKTPIATLALAAALAATAAGSASAKISEVNTRKISYADLDLSREAGARALLLRIRNAAVAVCTVGVDDPMQWQSANHRRCIKQASADAVAQARSPLVTALYGAKGSVVIAQK